MVSTQYKHKKLAGFRADPLSRRLARGSMNPIHEPCVVCALDHIIHVKVVYEKKLLPPFRIGWQRCLYFSQTWYTVVFVPKSPGVWDHFDTCPPEFTDYLSVVDIVRLQKHGMVRMLKPWMAIVRYEMYWPLEVQIEYARRLLEAM